MCTCMCTPHVNMFVNSCHSFIVVFLCIKHCSSLLKKIEGHLHVPEEFLEHIIIRLREPYSRCLEPANKKLEQLSQLCNLLGAIQEVSLV